jgi:glycine/D-amino acid oxidase-like deaminating enzyme
LVDTADIVIIGSGITGAAVARSILHESRRKATDQPKPTTVVVIEARQICSGATGRNGGHIKASPHETFHLMRKHVSPENAAALARFQLRHLPVLRQLCEEEEIDLAECRDVETVDIFADEAAYKQAVGQVEELKRWVPDQDINIWDAGDARKVSVESLSEAVVRHL